MPRSRPAAPPAGNLGPALEGRIDQALIRKPLHRFAIQRKVLGLPPHRHFPFNAEPGEVLDYRGLEFRPAARGVDVLDPQQQPSAGPPRQIEILSAE